MTRSLRLQAMDEVANALQRLEDGYHAEAVARLNAAYQLLLRMSE